MMTTHCDRHDLSRRWCRDCRRQRSRASLAEPRTWTVTQVAEARDDTAVLAAFVAIGTP
ncbi:MULTISPECIES: hypothetical protein [unclassified Crossiella]|uniref:hypothetical protein n=1 Tax=unclassified Crossiella TaxID=2620835 RepID=UPI002000044C|nr:MULTISPECIES: hypothetical protein [unclassified Crossiella]MCK2244752.1 hypothetical protein [Crossiella sp. S99.2]MCK2258250.1 hypothetical protein [Crossiella sp. S99.1]